MHTLCLSVHCAKLLVKKTINKTAIFTISAAHFSCRPGVTYFLCFIKEKLDRATQIKVFEKRLYIPLLSVVNSAMKLLNYDQKTSADLTTS